MKKEDCKDIKIGDLLQSKSQYGTKDWVVIADYVDHFVVAIIEYVKPGHIYVVSGHDKRFNKSEKPISYYEWGQITRRGSMPALVGVRGHFRYG